MSDDSDPLPYCGGCSARQEPNDNGDCPECGTLIQWVSIDAVPIEELEALADRLESQAKTVEERGYGPLFSEDYSNGIAAGVDYAETELRAVIEEYRGERDE